MSKFDALYCSIINEQVEPPKHALTIQNHIKLIGGIVKRQDVNKRPDVINQIMQGVINPKNNNLSLRVIGPDLANAVTTISKYIAAQPVDHRSDIIEHVRQSITHPANGSNK